MDHAPCHLISNEPIPDFPNIKIAYVGRCMTDKLQPLDNCIIAVLKNKYKKWLNLELFKNERLSKFDKIKKTAEILYSIRPEVGQFCWNNTIFRRNGQIDEPEEMHNSHYEVGEEMMQKLTYGLDQMYVEEDADGNEEFVDLVLVPVEENDGPPVDLEVLENRPKKQKFSQK